MLHLLSEASAPAQTRMESPFPLSVYLEGISASFLRASGSLVPEGLVEMIERRRRLCPTPGHLATVNGQASEQGWQP